MQPEGVSVVYTVALLLLLLPMGIFMLRQPGALRNLFIWVVILAALMWGYHFVVEVPRGTDTLPAATGSQTETPAIPAAPAQDSQSPVRNM